MHREETRFTQSQSVTQAGEQTWDLNPALLDVKVSSWAAELYSCFQKSISEAVTVFPWSQILSGSLLSEKKNR